MFRLKISWLLFAAVALIWTVVFFELSAFAAGEQQFIWTATTQPIPGSAQVIEMKPTMLAPKGMPPAPMRSLLARVLGKSLGGIIPNAGIVYSIIDLEGRRQSVAYAIEQLMKDGQPVNAQTIQEWIAQNNGIDVNNVPDDLDGSDNFLTYSGTSYSVTLQQNACTFDPPQVYFLINPDRIVVIDSKMCVPGNPNSSNLRRTYLINSSQPVSSFDPAD